MPLLKRKAFEKSTASEYLRDDDEVFHCEITDEIFKDYEEYCERIILVNSMVWTCEMTGKNNLTYAEALDSEKAARRSLRDFPMELRIPILYLAWKTNRCSFAEMSEDVFNFVRERYFVGETVEACLDGDNWQEAHVLTVTSQKQQPGSKVLLPPASYCYEVEQYEEDEAGQVGTVSHERVRRPKGVYTRDKSRLFLKQFVEQSGGIICIKKSALEKYNITKTHFDQIFTGSPPEFPSSKKLAKPATPNKAQTNSKPGSATKPKAGSATKPGSATKNKKKPSPDKKGRQESMDKFVKKTDGKPEAGPKKPANSANKKSAQDLAEMMRRAEDQMRKRKEEEKAKKKEKNARLQAYLKEWQKVKDDLDLEDQKVIPKGIPIEVEGIPHEHFGDFLSVLEFVYVYSDVLKTKDVFHNHELDLDTFRKALTLKEHAGVFSDVIQMFLATIFSLQEDEAEDYNESGGIEESTGVLPTTTSTGLARAVELATRASKWSQTYLGTPLSSLPLDPTTVSEVLRLHLLSSGSEAGRRCSLWRYHQRGGYSSADDAGLRLRVSTPLLLARLATTHVAEMTLEDKFQILQCLMNQVLSYATVRDVIEEKLEELKNTKHALRLHQTNERKREAQLTVARQELKKEFTAKKESLKLTTEKAAVDEELKIALEKLAKESEEKKREYQGKLKELQIQVFDYASYVGTDRAYRRFWLNQRVAGLFVEAGSEPRGPCRDKPVPPAPPRAPNAPAHDTLAYVTKLFETEKEKAGSDKENDSAANSRGNSPKKPLGALNGLNHKVTGASADADADIRKELLVCTGDISTCTVHGSSDRPYWTVYHTEEQIEALINSLNKRGVRESDLRSQLELDKDNIVEYVKKCPMHLLSPGLVPPPPVHHMSLKRKPHVSLLVPADSTLAEALELSLRDHILELEEKIFHGCLGRLDVKDREAWRGTLMLRGYDKQAEYLQWGPKKQYRDDYHLPNGEMQLPNGIEKSEEDVIPVNKYRDPGHYLEQTTQDSKQDGLEDCKRVRGLASALLQVAQGVQHKYIKRPLGLDDKERKDREAKNKPLDLEALERWEVSLMESRSFSAIVLHLFTLDSSITWSASILNASCRLCRRKTDPDNMLLCDGCNKGHHLYCLKPKLTKVPSGDWFCDQCKPKERTPRKKRKLFSDEDIKEALASDDDDEEDSPIATLAVCGLCGSGGRLRAACAVCARRYHSECAGATNGRTRAHRGAWICQQCSQPGRESYDSDDNTALVKLKQRKSRASRSDSDPPTATASGKKRGRKPKENGTSSTRKSKLSLTNGHHEEIKEDQTAAMEQLMKEVLKHRDSWPFYEPVSTKEVPDYLDVIETPMDLSTISSKLRDRSYTPPELLADLALVLTNCFTYNKDTHPVAKAGVRLEKYITRRAQELSLGDLPPTTEEPIQESSKRSAESLVETPSAKRAKHK